MTKNTSTTSVLVVTTNKTIQRNALKKHENHTSSSQSKEGHNIIFNFYMKLSPVEGLVNGYLWRYMFWWLFLELP